MKYLSAVIIFLTSGGFAANNSLISDVSFTLSGWNLLDPADSNLVNSTEEKVEERITNYFLDIRTKKKYNFSLNAKIPYSVLKVKKEKIDEFGMKSDLPLENKSGFTDLEFSIIYNKFGIKLYNSINIPMKYSTLRTSPWLGAGTYKYGNKVEINYFKPWGLIGIGSGIENNFNIHLNNSRVKKGNYENTVKMYVAAIYKMINFGFTSGYTFKKSNYDQLFPVIIPQSKKNTALYTLEDWEPNITKYVFIDSVTFVETNLYENTLGHQVLQIPSDTDPNSFTYPEILFGDYGKSVNEKFYGLGFFAGKNINDNVDLFAGYNGGFGLKNAPKSWSWWLQLKYKL